MNYLSIKEIYELGLLEDIPESWLHFYVIKRCNHPNEYFMVDKDFHQAAVPCFKTQENAQEFITANNIEDAEIEFVARAALNS